MALPRALQEGNANFRELLTRLNWMLGSMIGIDARALQIEESREGPGAPKRARDIRVGSRPVAPAAGHFSTLEASHGWSSAIQPNRADGSFCSVGFGVARPIAARKSGCLRLARTSWVRLIS
jgi:hypothetical protein